MRHSQRAAIASQAAASRMAERPYHQSAFIKPWFGMARGAGGRTRVTITWEPGDRAATRRLGAAATASASTVVLIARTADGAQLFSGRVAPVLARGVDGKDLARATFDAPPGRIEIEMTIEGTGLKVLDSDIRDVEVPNLNGAVTIIRESEVFRVRTARELVAVSADPDAAPVASREFSRTERLLIRVPAYGPGSAPAAVTATLFNRVGQVMLGLSALPLPGDGMTQFDVSLASLAPGDYRIGLVATSPAGEARADLSFRVTG